MSKDPEPLKNSITEDGDPMAPMMSAFSGSVISAFFGSVISAFILYAILDGTHSHSLWTVAAWHIRAGTVLATLLVVGDVVAACRLGAGLLVSRKTSLPILPLYWLYWFVAWPGALVAMIVGLLCEVRPVVIVENLTEGKRGGEVSPMEKNP